MAEAPQRTWIVVLRGAGASVFERSKPGAELIPVLELDPSEQPSMGIASWLDAARRARAFERFAIVAPSNDVDRVLADLSRPTRALLSAPGREDLQGLQTVATTRSEPPS